MAAKNTYELLDNMTLSVVGPAVVVVSPPLPTGTAPGYDPANDPQVEMLRLHLEAMGYDLAVTRQPKAEGEAPQGRFPRPKPPRGGPREGSPTGL
jgi:hypothetical protein